MLVSFENWKSPVLNYWQLTAALSNRGVPAYLRKIHYYDEMSVSFYDKCIGDPPGACHYAGAIRLWYSDRKYASEETSTFGGGLPVQAS